MGFRLRAESNRAAHELKVLSIWFRIQGLVSVQKINIAALEFRE